MFQERYRAFHVFSMGFKGVSVYFRNIVGCLKEVPGDSEAFHIDFRRVPGSQRCSRGFERCASGVTEDFKGFRSVPEGFRMFYGYSWGFVVFHECFRRSQGVPARSKTFQMISSAFIRTSETFQGISGA